MAATATTAALVTLLALTACRIIRWLRRYRSTSPVVAPGAPEFLSWSACRMAAAIRSQELTSLQVVEAAIAVLDATHSALNGLAWRRFTAARAEAEAADERVAAAAAAGRLDELPEFLGVPIMLKEAFEFAGEPYTYGLLSRKGCLGKKAGPIVRRVTGAGFIVVGAGNTSESCMWMESYNTVYGRSSSPFDTSRTPGGSSGGTAATVAVMGSPAGITADIGGSTRIPAHFCGLFGHKATGGLLPNTRTHCDNFAGRVCRICQPGVVTRHAEDLLPIVKLLAGPPDEEDADELANEYLPLPGWVAAPASSRPRLDLRNLKVVPLTFRGGWPRSAQVALMSSISAPLLEGQARAARHLQEGGAEVSPAFLEDLAVGEWFEAWASRNMAASRPFREVVCDGHEPFGALELVRYFAGFSKHTAPALGLALLEDVVEAVSPPLEQRLRAAQDVEDRLTAALTDAEGRDTVIVMPVLPRHGCKHDECLLRIPDSAFTCIWNALEFPSTAVPLGLDSRGLPHCLQIVSLRGNDELTMAVASELARAGIARCDPPGHGRGSCHRA